MYCKILHQNPQCNVLDLSKVAADVAVNKIGLILGVKGCALTRHEWHLMKGTMKRFTVPTHSNDPVWIIYWTQRGINASSVGLGAYLKTQPWVLVFSSSGIFEENKW